MSADRRSVHPDVPGAPWWGAVLIALIATTIGFAFDAGGGKELTHVFAAFYVIGCLAAVLMVRQSGIFTAIVQPPMILFVMVPGAYFLFHGAKITGLKDVVINCAYPLVERFPLMVFTSGTVLLIGLGRWFLGSRAEEEAAPAKASAKASAKDAPPSRLAALTSKLTEMLPSKSAEEDTPKRRHAVEKSKKRRTQPAKRAEPTRRRQRVLDDDLPRERPRRRAAPAWQPEEPVDLPRRRSPAARAGRNPYDRREPYERRAPHDRRGRYDSYDPVEYDPFEAYEVAPRRRPSANGAAVANGSHHPISRVRYRGSPVDTDTRQERPVRSQSPRWEADSWEYDI